MTNSTTPPAAGLTALDVLREICEALEDGDDFGARQIARNAGRAALSTTPPAAEHQKCQPDGLKFDAFGEPRTRYVRVSLNGSHCVMHPSEGDRYIEDARGAGDESQYVVADVWLSEREFENLGEFDGF